jgi:hypothetical protein
MVLEGIGDDDDLHRDRLDTELGRPKGPAALVPPVRPLRQRPWSEQHGHDCRPVMLR